MPVAPHLPDDEPETALVTLELATDGDAIDGRQEGDDLLPDDYILFPEECPLDPTPPSLVPDKEFEAPKARFRLVAGLTHAVSHVPPCVWVRNASEGPITVVVSRFGPLKTLTGAGIGASASGGGLDFKTETFSVGATKKTVPAPRRAEKPGRETTARFPLWTRSCDAGVVTVYVGSAEVPIIENDRLPAGSVGLFKGEGEEMEVYDHHGRKIDDGMPIIGS